MRRLLIVAMLAGCATAKPRACAQARVAIRAPQASTALKTLDAGISDTDAAIGLRTLDGRPANFVDYMAPVTVLAFWATWCHPCLEELPYVEMLHQLYENDRDISIVAVSIDSPSARELIRTTVAELRLAFPVLHDPDQWLFRQYSEQIQIPLLVFIDRDFKQYREVGFTPVSVYDFLANKRYLIELARAGSLANEPSRPSVLDAMRLRNSATMRFVKGTLTEASRPAVRARLKSMFPDSTEKELDEMMVKADEAARTGEQVRFEK